MRLQRRVEWTRLQADGMENRRGFARQATHQTAFFEGESESVLGEIRDISLGGLRARLPKRCFELGERVRVSPQKIGSLEYEICWIKPMGAGMEVGFRYPHSIANFWHSWAAELIAGERPTHGRVTEKRSQVRLDCSLKGSLKTKRKNFDVQVLDLGAGGALVELKEDLTVGAKVHLTIKNPIRVGHVASEVVRVFSETTPRYGLSFVKLKERHRLALIRVLDLILRSQNEENPS